ncbi:T9SS type A sorting domain-containing protein [Flavobacterium sandaracinum]|uniref:T9SS type A sorting domain-containing protein n=2 Tax=Flavobacterium sandaracinum TaxID=2541733 RepID=A0A4R5CNU8_9FLAO|nr:T9SS type A sorting domain-containing protein [Flavobacterium sandaracinum]
MMIVTVLLIQNPIKAQMYVSPNSYVFASNEVVFIGQDLALNAATSAFYLRENAQLLQGSTGDGANSGLGSLSVFQKGSTNNFQYNYWCSPVGGTIATAGNSPFGVTQLKDIDGLITFKEPSMLPMNNYNGTASPLAIAPFWINKLTIASQYSSWIQVGSNSSLNAGEGFTMKGTSGTNVFTINGVQNNPGSQQRYDFRGKPNDGTITIPVGFEQFTLTGNPYPSAIDLSAFLIEQTNCTGIAYFWEQDPTVNSHFIADYKGGYGTFAPGDLGSTGVYVPATFYSYDGSGNEGSEGGTGGEYERRFSPIGQGFLIDGDENGTVQMKNSYRVFVKETPVVASSSKIKSTAKAKSTTSFMTSMQAVSGFDYSTVSVAPTPQIRFNTLMNNQGVRQLALALIPEATDGVDRAMDALSSGDNDQSDVYFVIEGSEFIINAVNFDIDKKIAIGFRNNKPANYKITVKEMVNFTGANEVYLHDKVKDAYYDIKNDFHELDLPTGENNSQFEITFKNNGTLDVDEAAAENFVIFQNNPTKNVVISNPLLMDLDTFGLYDVAGKLIFVKKDLGVNASYEFSTSGLGDGIYIVKLAAKDKGVVGKKVIIKN